MTTEPLPNNFFGAPDPEKNRPFQSSSLLPPAANFFAETHSPQQNLSEYLDPFAPAAGSSIAQQEILSTATAPEFWSQHAQQIPSTTTALESSLNISHMANSSAFYQQYVANPPASELNFAQSQQFSQQGRPTAVYPPPEASLMPSQQFPAEDQPYSKSSYQSSQLHPGTLTSNPSEPINQYTQGHGRTAPNFPLPHTEQFPITRTSGPYHPPLIVATDANFQPTTIPNYQDQHQYDPKSLAHQSSDQSYLHARGQFINPPPNSPELDQMSVKSGTSNVDFVNPKICTRCTKANSPDANFCGQCGGKLSSPPLPSLSIHPMGLTEHEIMSNFQGLNLGPKQHVENFAVPPPAKNSFTLPDAHNSYPASAAQPSMISQLVSPTSQIERRIYPVVSFGFGGKLIITFPSKSVRFNNPSSASKVSYSPNLLHILPIANVMGVQDQLISPLTNCNNGMPFFGLSTVELVRNIELLFKNDESLPPFVRKNDGWGKLRGLMIHLVNSHGKIFRDEHSENIVRKLLLGDNIMSENAITECNADNDPICGTANSATIKEICTFLVKGDRASACKLACSQKLWSHALLLASHVDRATYYQVISEFAQSSLPLAHPLRILYQLFAGQASAAGAEIHQASDISSNSGTIPDVTFLNQWSWILAMVLANRTPDDLALIIAMGDGLARLGDVASSHFCYLLCDEDETFASIIGPVDSETGRITLIGSVSPFVYPETFFKDWESIRRTELLETCLKLEESNPGSSGKGSKRNFNHLIPFKLSLINWMIDLGLIPSAYRHLSLLLSEYTVSTTNVTAGMKGDGYHYKMPSAVLYQLQELHERITTFAEGDPKVLGVEKESIAARWPNVQFKSLWDSFANKVIGVESGEQVDYDKTGLGSDGLKSGKGRVKRFSVQPEAISSESGRLDNTQTYCMPTLLGNDFGNVDVAYQQNAYTNISPVEQNTQPAMGEFLATSHLAPQSLHLPQPQSSSQSIHMQSYQSIHTQQMYMQPSQTISTHQTHIQPPQVIPTHPTYMQQSQTIPKQPTHMQLSQAVPKHQAHMQLPSQPMQIPQPPAQKVHEGFSVSPSNGPSQQLPSIEVSLTSPSRNEPTHLLAQQHQQNMDYSGPQQPSQPSFQYIQTAPSQPYTLPTETTNADRMTASVHASKTPSMPPLAQGYGTATEPPRHFEPHNNVASVEPAIVSGFDRMVSNKGSGEVALGLQHAPILPPSPILLEQAMPPQSFTSSLHSTAGVSKPNNINLDCVYSNVLDESFDDANYPKMGKDSSTGFSASVFPQSQTSHGIEDEFGLGNAKKNSDMNAMLSNDGEDKQTKGNEKEAQSLEKTAPSGGMLKFLTGWLSKKSDDGGEGVGVRREGASSVVSSGASTGGAKKANLGEPSSFRYDPELKRWVSDKLGDLHANLAPPPLPPPSASGSVLSVSLEASPLKPPMIGSGGDELAGSQKRVGQKGIKPKYINTFNTGMDGTSSSGTGVEGGDGPAKGPLSNVPSMPNIPMPSLNSIVPPPMPFGTIEPSI